MRNEFTAASRMQPVRSRGRRGSQRIGVRSQYGSRVGTGALSAIFCAAVVIAVTFAAQVNSVTRAQSSTGAIWEGEIEYVQRISIGDSAGQFRYTWTMSARWVESGRIDVTGQALERTTSHSGERGLEDRSLYENPIQRPPQPTAAQSTSETTATSLPRTGPTRPSSASVTRRWTVKVNTSTTKSADIFTQNAKL